MRYVYDLCIGLIIYFSLKCIREKSKAVKAGVLFLLALMLIVLPGYKGYSEGLMPGMIIDYCLVAVMAILLFVCDSRLGKIFTGLEMLNRPFDRPRAADQEDFMNTRLGKIMTVTCIILVIYMIISMFCIYKLNTKINTLYNSMQSSTVSEGSAKDK